MRLTLGRMYWTKDDEESICDHCDLECKKFVYTHCCGEKKIALLCLRDLFYKKTNKKQAFMPIWCEEHITELIDIPHGLLYPYWCYLCGV